MRLAFRISARDCAILDAIATAHPIGRAGALRLAVLLGGGFSLEEAEAVNREMVDRRLEHFARARKALPGAVKPPPASGSIKVDLVLPGAVWERVAFGAGKDPEKRRGETLRITREALAKGLDALARLEWHGGVL